MRYAVVIESGPENLSAYVPDLPGCIATGKTLDEVLTNIRGATEFHLEGLRADGLLKPQPTTRCEYIEPLRNLEPRNRPRLNNSFQPTGSTCASYGSLRKAAEITFVTADRVLAVPRRLDRPLVHVRVAAQITIVLPKFSDFGSAARFTTSSI